LNRNELAASTPTPPTIPNRYFCIAILLVKHFQKRFL
jgi:hypothetical protein